MPDYIVYVPEVYLVSVFIEADTPEDAFRLVYTEGEGDWNDPRYADTLEPHEYPVIVEDADTCNEILRVTE